METGDQRQHSRRPVVRVPTHPVEAVAEADAVDAALRQGDLAVRGPLFGIAARADADGERWRVVSPLTSTSAQMARDSLNFILWNQTRDDSHNWAERRELLAAVERLESDRANDIAALGIRYRVVRAEEYAVTDERGIEPPRPSDPEPPVPDWGRDAADPRVDDGLVLDPDAPVTPAQVLEIAAVRELSYAGTRFADHVIADSLRAVDTHPDVVLLPAVFNVVSDTGTGWKAVSGPHATAHAARRSLDSAVTWLWPRLHAGGAEPDEETVAPYREASAAFRAAGRANRLDLRGTAYLIARTRRFVRWGPGGPEAPRPSDAEDERTLGQVTPDA